MKPFDLVEDNEGDKGVVTDVRIAASQEQIKVRYDCTDRESGWVTAIFFTNLTERVRELDVECWQRTGRWEAASWR